MSDKIDSYRDLRVYENSISAAMEIFNISKNFPREEQYSLVDQVRRSSRSVSANLAEAWRKRRYKKAFLAKLNDCESEAAETRVWLEFANRCGFIDREKLLELDDNYEHILRQISRMIKDNQKWVLEN